MVGYFVKGDTIINVSGGNHIGYIIQNPEQFDLTTKEIKSIYKSHKEPMGSEGDAREYIIKKASESGWIRVRAYKEYWSIQCDVIRFRKKPIKNFVYWAIYKSKVMKRTDSLAVLGYRDNEMEKYQAAMFLRENKEQGLYKSITYATLFEKL